MLKLKVIFHILLLLLLSSLFMSSAILFAFWNWMCDYLIIMRFDGINCFLSYIWEEPWTHCVNAGDQELLSDPPASTSLGSGSLGVIDPTRLPSNFHCLFEIRVIYVSAHVPVDSSTCWRGSAWAVFPPLLLCLFLKLKPRQVLTPVL